jgi:hypothetical protein
MFEREAKERQREAGERGKEGGRGKKKGTKKTLGATYPKGLTRVNELLGQAVGLSRSTYEKVAAVIESDIVTRGP